MTEPQAPERIGLADYLLRQLEHFFPDGRDERPVVLRHLDEALERLQYCIDGVAMWPVGRFDPLHSTQYAIFLYYLSNTIWRNEAQTRAPTKLFLLNKALNGIDCFYEVALPRRFFIGHTVGIVLAKAHYGEHLVLYQNSTVGKNHGVAPHLGEGVVLYPNTAVIGASRLGDGTIVSQGVSVINRDTPGNCLVFQGSGGDLVLRPAKRDILADFFRPPGP